MEGFEGFDDKPTFHTENKWYKNNSIKEAVTGYSLRGGQKLKSAVAGLKETLQRGVQKTYEGTHIRVLDARKNGVALDIEIELMTKLERGNAMVKLYGPYGQKEKKENVIMVTKIKRSPVKFVEILAEKIIKPLIAKFVNDENVDENTEELNSCSVCERTFKSPAGLKTHITTKHKAQSREISSSEEVLLLEKEAAKVVNSIEYRIEELDDEEAFTINETCDIESNVKEYSEICQICDFKVRAERKYLALQLINKHKKEIHTKSCDDCGFKAQNLQEMKRHERDTHGKINISTSPPTKRKRKSTEIVSEIIEAMDTEDDIRNQVDEMEVDEEENDSAKFKRELSEKMDTKVKEKQQKIEESVKKWFEDKQAGEKKKHDIEEKINENRKKSKKIIKQKSKDKRKRVNRRNKNENKNNAPNIKNIPLNCKKFVNDDDKLYIVPGNGACAFNAAAAHLFHDEKMGPTLRIKSNIFLAENYEHYKDIFPCSKSQPYIRRLKGEQKRFEDPEELKKFLLTSQEAGYMWSDSEDLKIISDLYQIKIKIITMKSSTDEDPTVNWIIPDKNMSDIAELKDVNIEDLVLLHENDNHFDLVVAESSELIKFGGLSDRNIMSQNKNDDIIKTNEEENNHKKTVQELKAEIKNLEKKNELFKKQYMDCERELKLKTEETERLKTELKDVKLKISLENEIRINEDLDNSIAMKNEKFKCKDCDCQFIKQEALIKHIILKHEKETQTCTEGKNQCNTEPDMKNHDLNHEEEFNCNDCDYQGDSLELLQKHIRFTHTMEKYKCTKCKYQGSGGKDLYTHTKNVHTKELDIKCSNCEKRCAEVEESSKHIERKHSLVQSIKCKNCGNEFSTKNKLMIHRKVEHPETVAACRNNLEGKCRYEADLCWWNHRKGEETKIECFFCDEIFKTKTQVMNHRKKEHLKTVKPCLQFQAKKCQYNDNECWFKHGNIVENTPELGFRDVREKSMNT